ncbi:hypothetical protein CAC42_1564 [Sphaceloma murrayae]|uniref:DASH complex subunit SPC34 n=1 Tax=Sphaceloma murrayae TaxID=2082308 RepID=A0A2K1R347_9PEZI|nr:hypothetical protein CAC42_1564 [Sphaceloma murrayae]
MATTLLSSHLEQISACAASISELEFPKPKQFENSLLSQHDITALIRDTEIHERALFSIAPPPLPSKPDLNASAGSSYNARASATPHASRAPKRNTAVAAVLGRDLFRKVREADGTTSTNSYGAKNRSKGELNVEVLLQGASRLSEVYPVAGAAGRIEKLRARFEQLSANIAHYEDRVARNAKQLDGMYARQGWEEEDDDGESIVGGVDTGAASGMTREDLEREEKEIRDLERKKKGLESRVSEMEKDLGGLMR